MRFGLFVAVLCAALSACASDPKFGAEPGQPLAVTQSTELPPPSGADQIAVATNYVIGPLDKLTIKVYGVDDLGGDVQTDAAGRISMPLVGTVQAVGRTPDQLADTIRQSLTKYVKDPRVTVNIREATSQTFTVDGQVTEPGIYPVVGNMSLLRAIATAKGPSEFAKLDDVVVFRKVNGKSMAALYNLTAIRRGTYADPQIYANDVVVVGDSKARRLFKNVLNIAPALATPLVLLLQ